MYRPQKGESKQWKPFWLYFPFHDFMSSAIKQSLKKNLTTLSNWSNYKALWWKLIHHHFCINEANINGQEAYFNLFYVSLVILVFTKRWNFCEGVFLYNGDKFSLSTMWRMTWGSWKCEDRDARLIWQRWLEGYCGAEQGPLRAVEP